jgi:hypothetical protein
MELSRREFGGLAAAAGLAAAPPPASVPRTVSMSHIRYWQACTDVLYVRDRAVGGTVLLASALQQWQRVAVAAKGASAGESGRQLLAAAGELALCTGWVALDGGRLPLARPLYEQARELAAGAGDVMLAVHVLTSQSMLYAEMARTGPSREPARQALRLAYQAAGEGRYMPSPRLHALIALRHASAASLLGDKAAFQAAIGQARRELDRGPRDGDPPQWLRFVTQTEVTGVEARGHLNLGDAGRAAMLYRQVLTCELSPRNRASYGAGLADALLQQGARPEAVAAAMDVLPSLEGGVTSMRCLNRLRIVRQAAGNTAGAQEFRDRFDAAEQALTATCNLPRDDAPANRADIPALYAAAVIPQRRLRQPTARERPDARLRSCGSNRLAAGSRHGREPCPPPQVQLPSTPCLIWPRKVAHACGLTASRVPSGSFDGWRFGVGRGVPGPLVAVQIVGGRAGEPQPSGLGAVTDSCADGPAMPAPHDAAHADNVQVPGCMLVSGAHAAFLGPAGRAVHLRLRQGHG